MYCKRDERVLCRSHDPKVVLISKKGASPENIVRNSSNVWVADTLPRKSIAQLASSALGSGACHCCVPIALPDWPQIFESFAVARPKSARQALWDCVIRMLTFFFIRQIHHQVPVDNAHVKVITQNSI
jgi:hypothetical protein